jgi:hypothetical protein
MRLPRCMQEHHGQVDRVKRMVSLRHRYCFGWVTWSSGNSECASCQTA